MLYRMIIPLCFLTTLAHAVIGEGLTWAKASYDSIYGRIVSSWKLEGGILTLDVTIPANTTATVHVPGRDGGIHEVGPGNTQFKSAMNQR